MRLILSSVCLLVAVAAIGIAASQPAASPVEAPPLITNVLVVTMDGMRWQEVFGGLSYDLLSKKAGGVTDPAPVERRFGAPSPGERRERLMPFFWTVAARQGQIFGDPSRGSVARVTNGLRFSYPGYNELLAGFPDSRIDSNDRIPNPNVTVLEWLNRRPAFAGRVAAFASWELLPWILNEPRSGIPCNGEGAPVAEPATDRDRLLNELSADLPPYWGATRFDAPTGFGALEYLRARRPRVLYVMLGETDEWAHGRRYDLYLDAAQRNDRFIRRLWEAAQSMPEYANRTALILSTDHGRGDTAADWTDHGREVPAAERIWMAVMGPGVPPLGIRAGVTVTQSQVAATIAALLGENYTRAQPKAAPPLDLSHTAAPAGVLDSAVSVPPCSDHHSPRAPRQAARSREPLNGQGCRRRARGRELIPSQDQFPLWTPQWAALQGRAARRGCATSSGSDRRTRR